MKKKVADILGSAALPVMICVASDNAGSEETDLTVSLFSDATTDNKFSVMSNIENPHSPASGEYIAAGEQKPVETASMNRIETLAGLVCVANCVGCKHDTYTTTEVAEALDGKAFYCTSCGEQVEAFYDGDFKAETASEDDEDFSEDDAEDVVDVVEEDDTSEEDVEDDTTSEEEEVVEEDVESEEDVDDSETLEDEEVEVASAESLEEEQPVADATDSAERTVKVETASVANYDGNLQFASLSDTSRLEVFLGNTHIGSLLKDEASANVQKQFANASVLRSAFGTQFWKHSQEIASGDTKSLDEFGFQPAVIAVAVDKVIASEIDAFTADIQATSETKTAELTDSVVSTIQTAMAGLDKGLFKGPSLVRELSQELARFNVQKPVEVAKRFAERFSAPYFHAVVAKAAELRTQTPDFVRGLAVTVENASYNVEESIQESAALITSAASSYRTSRPPEVSDAVVEQASAVKPAAKADGTKFKSIFDKMARR